MSFDHPGPPHPDLPQSPGLSGPLSRGLPGEPGEGRPGLSDTGLRVFGHRLFPGLFLHLPGLRLPGGPLGPPPPHGRRRGALEPRHQPDLLGGLLPLPAGWPGAWWGWARPPSAPWPPAYLADILPLGRRARALGWFYLALPVGSALAYLVGGLMGSHWGWRPAFLLAGRAGPGHGRPGLPPAARSGHPGRLAGLCRARLTASWA